MSYMSLASLKSVPERSGALNPDHFWTNCDEADPSEPVDPEPASLERLV